MNIRENEQIPDEAFIDLLPPYLASQAQGKPDLLRTLRIIHEDFGAGPSETLHHQNSESVDRSCHEAFSGCCEQSQAPAEATVPADNTVPLPSEESLAHGTIDEQQRYAADAFPWSCAQAKFLSASGLRPKKDEALMLAHRTNCAIRRLNNVRQHQRDLCSHHHLSGFLALPRCVRTALRNCKWTISYLLFPSEHPAPPFLPSFLLRNNHE